MVPMLTCGLVRSNFAFATGVLLWTDHFFARHARLRRLGLCRLLARVRPMTDRTRLNAQTRGTRRPPSQCCLCSPPGALRSALVTSRDAQAPVAFAMISFAT